MILDKILLQHYFPPHPPFKNGTIWPAGTCLFLPLSSCCILAIFLLTLPVITGYSQLLVTIKSIQSFNWYFSNKKTSQNQRTTRVISKRIISQTFILIFGYRSYNAFGKICKSISFRQLVSSWMFPITFVSLSLWSKCILIGASHKKSEREIERER